MFLLTQTLRAQLDNRIFSFYPQPFYFIQKTKPDTTIYPPLSVITEAPNETDSLELSEKSIEQSIEPSLENSPSLSGTYANYMTGTHWGMLHYNKDNEYLQRINPGETLFIK